MELSPGRLWDLRLFLRDECRRSPRRHPGDRGRTEEVVRTLLPAGDARGRTSDTKVAPRSQGILVQILPYEFGESDFIIP